jgi:hypothetical protein
MRGGGTGQEYSDVVSEAQAMVAVQANCSPERALELLHATAEATSESVAYVAAEVVAGRATFDRHEYGPVPPRETMGTSSRQRG